MASNAEFFQVIGHVSVFFATLDFMVSILVKELVAGTPLEADRASWRVLGHDATLGQKIRFLAEVDPRMTSHPDIARAAADGIERARAVCEERNRFIHDQWVFAPELVSHGKIRRLRLTSGTDQLFEPSEFSLSELHDFLREVGQVQGWVSTLLERVPSSGWRALADE